MIFSRKFAFFTVEMTYPPPVIYASKLRTKKENKANKGDIWKLKEWKGVREREIVKKS